MARCRAFIALARSRSGFWSFLTTAQPRRCTEVATNTSNLSESNRYIAAPQETAPVVRTHFPPMGSTDGTLCFTSRWRLEYLTLRSWLMTITQALAPHLPYLRRYARALTGSQKSGDAYVRASLQALLAGEQNLASGVPPRVALYKLFHTIWSSPANRFDNG